jgi:hypothetical protein
MTLSTHTRLNAPRGFHPANFHRNPAVRLPVPAAKATPFASTQAAGAQHILVVEFTSPDGGAWQAIGGGDTLADAIAFAHDSCPTHTTWQPKSWSDLHGD